MDAIFLEILIDAVAPEDRQQIEDRLEAALEAASVGEVSGGGTGGETSNIDVEVTDLELGLAVIRSVLRSFDVGLSACIRQYEPVEVTHFVHEPGGPERS